ncbi:MAG: hypothetical protein ACFCAD_17750 [Pleurocapsa sp.]
MKYPHWLTVAGIATSILLIDTPQSSASISVTSKPAEIKVKQNYYAYSQPGELANNLKKYEQNIS